MASLLTMTDGGPALGPAPGIPAVIGGYVLQDRIGVGGMGVVYRATDTRLRRDIALKLINPALMGESSSVGRFQREAFTAAGLEHPNILPVYDAGNDNGVPYIATRLVLGPSLQRLMAHVGINPQEGMRIIRQLASALDAVHDAGICHRDVTPGNVLVAAGANGLHAYLTDFGLAAPLGQVPDEPRGGTPGYRAPEHCLGLRCCSQTDVYGLARLAGTLLGVGATGALASVIRRATNPDPMRRPSRPGELIERLREAAETEQVVGNTVANPSGND